MESNSTAETIRYDIRSPFGLPLCSGLQAVRRHRPAALHHKHLQCTSGPALPTRRRLR